MRKCRASYYAYIVEGTDRTYYAGATNNLEKRLKSHNAGNGAKYLRGRAPVELVYAQEYKNYKRALEAERELKKLTRKQKEDLINKLGGHP